jgi:hypothetical protein
VQAPGSGIDERGQRLDVGGEELREPAIVEDLRRERMLAGQPREDVAVGREPGLPAAHAA